MSQLSHMQVLEAIVDLATQVMPTVMEAESVIHVEDAGDCRTQLRDAAIVVLNHPELTTAELSTYNGVQWPPLFDKSDPHYLRVFIALVRAIYN